MLRLLNEDLTGKKSQKTNPYTRSYKIIPSIQVA